MFCIFDELFVIRYSSTLYIIHYTVHCTVHFKILLRPFHLKNNIFNGSLKMTKTKLFFRIFLRELFWINGFGYVKEWPYYLGSSCCLPSQKKNEKYDISKYEIPKTKYEALRISSKLVLQIFLRGEKNLIFRNLVLFVFFL